MAIKIYSGSYSKLVGIVIQVEVDITKGMPSFNIVGLPDAAVKESRERVRSAIMNTGYEFPLGRITINLAPADVRKVGSLLDLPIALGILMETNQIKKANLDKYIFIGELSLIGEIKTVRGTLPIVLEALDEGFENLIFPYDNLNECVYAGNGLYYPFDNLKEVISFINYNDVLPLKAEDIEKNEEEVKYFDFENIIGQENSKRAMEIAAAGRHSIVLYGSTGVGKTMLAKAFTSILPALTMEEELEIAKIYSVSGLIEKNKRILRPFRMPHHTITVSSMVGGGNPVKAGEVTLANKGVLFLDELLEFKRDVLEVLREPLEEKEVHINRLMGNVNLPADFMLLASFNLCPCGKMSLDPIAMHECSCSERDRSRYLKKLSKAMRDRIDIFSYVPKVKYEEIKIKNENYTSSKMKERVFKARYFQKERLKGTGYYYNSEIKGRDIFELCVINEKCKDILEQYFNHSKPSLRAYGKVIKLARTIADLESEKDVNVSHIIEALSFRKDYNGEIV